VLVVVLLLALCKPLFARSICRGLNHLQVNAAGMAGYKQWLLQQLGTIQQFVQRCSSWVTQAPPCKSRTHRSTAINCTSMMWMITVGGWQQQRMLHLLVRVPWTTNGNRQLFAWQATAITCCHPKKGQSQRHWTRETHMLPDAQLWEIVVWASLQGCHYHWKQQMSFI
jgi:hypothetical protein